MSAEYLCHMLDPIAFEHKCERVASNIRKMRRKIPFDCIAFTGMSGCLIAPAICRQLKVHMLPIRKAGVKHHGNGRIETHYAHVYKRSIILDDFVEEGSTVRKLIKLLREDMPNNKVVGLALHRRLDIDNFDIAPRLHRVYGIIPVMELPCWFV